MQLIVACVRTGDKYSMDYVLKLRNMVARNLLRAPYEFICLTDRPDRCDATSFIDITALELPGWWGKMALFEPAWRKGRKVLYLDLDTVVCGNLEPLTAPNGELAILQSPVRLAGNFNYPCAYNSSVMVIGSGMASFVWTAFEKRAALLMAKHDRYGDQAAIEELCQHAPHLQRLMPEGFFLNYRDLTMHKPKAAAVVNFAGTHKPHNCDIPWIVEAWK
jgi:hypothetical protein